ncbi:dipeptide/oligopeptide/nickel ABC transporter ATP-binding protein [Alicyclobacillus cellulosilyticus]|uniref:Dipeptide/oligopeptide/nickel ABC transporter ATP-binding protein n=1 Tax=Alicyclobacillus cellulosilyticus TaxID=1003997 RepID=A0A917NIA7_9BACL|nr:ABC transporter ATP-binding protein [Alicyclobacillus cellulosilyticus]GGJ02931.1 dipeptide/oligopeptide/nickel ABC transporter ATP-binding protein [Alicyclobacillus cellulosilyticus]
MAPLLNISDLKVTFHADRTVVHAVNGVDLCVDAGRAVAIVGESGSGKSTVMMAVMRLLGRRAHVSGRIEWDGQDLLALPERAMRQIRGRAMGMIFQNPSSYLNPTKTIGEQMIEPVLFHRIASASAARRQAVQLLEQVGIPDPEQRLRLYPFELSGGQLQRVMIAMALMTRPKLLIADEPTTALDVTVQAEVLVLLKRLQRELGMALVFITHDLAVAAQVAEEIYVMYGGFILEHLPAAELTQRKAHPYLRGLLGSIPRLDGPRTPLPFIPGQPLDTARGLPEGCVFADRCAHRMSRCAQRPPMIHVGSGHRAACWLAEEEVTQVWP